MTGAPRAAQPAPGAAARVHDGAPAFGAAELDAYEPATHEAFDSAQGVLKDLPKHNICGDAKAYRDKQKRENIIAGLENVRYPAVILREVAGIRLGLGADLEEGDVPTSFDDVVVKPAPRAPGDRPDDVEKRPKNNEGEGPASGVELAYEDGKQDFDAPVTEAEIVDNRLRLINSIKQNDQSDAAKLLRLEYERELVEKGGGLPPRMQLLTLKGSLSRLLDVAEGLGVKPDRKTIERAKKELRALIRTCTEETQPLPLEIMKAATPGAEVRVGADDGVTTMFVPAITRWPIDDQIDNLLIKKDGKRFHSALRTPMRGGKDEGQPTNASSLQGGRGSGGKGALPSSACAERRWAVFRLKVDEFAHQAVVASIHEDFLHLHDELRPKMNALVRRRGGEIVSPRRQAPHYEVPVGKLRLQPPRSALIAALRIYGTNGLLEPGLENPTEHQHPFLADEQKKDDLAAYLLLHAILYADYENIRSDLSRRVLPIFTDHSIQRFWTHAIRGLGNLMRAVNASSVFGDFKFDEQGLARIGARLERVDVNEEGITKSDVSVMMLTEILTVLSPYGKTQRGALTKIAGAEVTHGFMVRDSLERTLNGRVTKDYVADLKEFRDASKAACESLVRSAEHILRLKPSGSTKLLGRGTSLTTKQKDGRSSFAHIFKTVKDDNKDKKFVHFVVLRLSQEDTVESETRFGFGVQVDMWIAQFIADMSDTVYGNRADHHIVWLVSAGRSRLAADQLDAPVAIFEEDPKSKYRLPDLKTMKTATVRTAIGVALAAEGKDRERRPVVMSAMYSDRVALEEFTDAWDAGVRVVGFDAFDLRPLIDSFPEIALGREGWKRRMIHVERGYGGNALVAHRLGCALAVPCDLNVLRNAGFEAANQDSDAPSDEKTRRNMQRVADYAARPLKVFENVIFPRWFEAVKKPDVNGQTPMPPEPRTFGSKNNKIAFKPSKFTLALRHSGLGQMWRSQLQMFRWAGVLGLTKVYSRPFPATIDLTATDAEVSGNIWVTDRLWADDGSSPAPEPGKRGKKSDIPKANFFASTSRAANPGVLEHAHENQTWFCLVDVAIAVKQGNLNEVWVCADESPSDFARRTNLGNPYVYAVLRAIRDGGHLPHRYLLGKLTTLGRAGAQADADAVASASAGA